MEDDTCWSYSWNPTQAGGERVKQLDRIWMCPKNITDIIRITILSTMIHVTIINERLQEILHVIPRTPNGPSIPVTCIINMFYSS